MLDLSVIIPVYNCEEYIKNCVCKILENKTVDIECIVVNDGSTDGTLDVLTDLQNNYTGLIVIDQENNGVSSARNSGLEIASGRFITFIDSDDYIEEFDFSFLKTTKMELFCLNMCKYIKNEVKSIPFLNIDLIGNFINFPIYMNSVCNKIFVTQTIKNNNLKFDMQQWVSEDLLFVFSYILLIDSNRITYLNGEYYVYRDNYDSVTKTRLSVETVENNILAYKKIERKLSEQQREKYRLFLKYLRVRMNFPFLTNEHVFNPSIYRENTEKFDLWIYEGRIDKFIVSLLAKMRFDFLLKFIAVLRKKL